MKEFCECKCHLPENKGMKHFVACCRGMCPKCGRYVKDAHKHFENCKAVGVLNVRIL
jgi:hypothetical protein